VELGDIIESRFFKLNPRWSDSHWEGSPDCECVRHWDWMIEGTLFLRLVVSPLARTELRIPAPYTFVSIYERLSCLGVSQFRISSEGCFLILLTSSQKKLLHPDRAATLIFWAWGVWPFKNNFQKVLAFSTSHYRQITQANAISIKVEFIRRNCPAVSESCWIRSKFEKFSNGSERMQIQINRFWSFSDFGKLCYWFGLHLIFLSQIHEIANIRALVDRESSFSAHTTEPGHSHVRLLIASTLWWIVWRECSAQSAQWPSSICGLPIPRLWLRLRLQLRPG
jgi:hypothetical protein